MIKRLLKVAFAEWKLMYTDPAAVLLLVVAGVLYAFYDPTPYINQTVSKVPVAVVDLDNTAMSRELTRMATAAQQIEVKAVYADRRQAEESMSRDEIYGFMVIPEDMEKNIRNHEQVSVNIFTHGAYVMLHGAIGTAFSTCALTLGATDSHARPVPHQHPDVVQQHGRLCQLRGAQRACGDFAAVAHYRDLRIGRFPCASPFPQEVP